MDKKHLPVLGPKAQSFEDSLGGAERKTFYGTGPGDSNSSSGPGDDPWIMGLSSKNRKSWFEVMPQKAVDAQFAKNYNRMMRAQAKAKDPNRPTNILIITCSGRNNKLSCAHMESRSHKILTGVKRKFEEKGANARLIDLWDLNIEHCNGCYGSHQAWCHWPCSCWPMDDMYDVYEAFLLADGVVIGSPVNEASAASRLYQMWHRMISMDGGLEFAPPKGWQKSAEELKRFKEFYGDELPYIQRWGNKPFGVVVMGHEIGSQTAASQIGASIYSRGAYIPPKSMVTKIYMGAGPSQLDQEVVMGHNYVTEELETELGLMVDQLFQHANLYRRIPREINGGDRT